MRSALLVLIICALIVVFTLIDFFRMVERVENASKRASQVEEV